MYGEALLRQQLRKFPPAALLVLLFSSYFLGFECVCVCAPHASTLRKKRAHHMYRRGGGGGGGCLQGGEGDRHGKIKREGIGREGRKWVGRKSGGLVCWIFFFKSRLLRKQVCFVLVAPPIPARSLPYPSACGGVNQPGKTQIHP